MDAENFNRVKGNYNKFFGKKHLTMPSFHCKICGGSIIGDGYTDVRRCENAKYEDYRYHEPDAKTVYCKNETVVQVDIEKSGSVAEEIIGK